MRSLISVIILFLITNANSQCLSGNCNNGYGLKKYKDGTIYVGEWWNDTPSGKGTVIWSDGSIYVGDFSKGMYSGNGTLVNQQTLYVGEFFKNEPNGFGSLFSNPGHMYVGNFTEGKMNGQGFFQHKNGVIEEANWKNNQPLGDILIERNDYILRSIK